MTSKTTTDKNSNPRPARFMLEAFTADTNSPSGGDVPRYLSEFPTEQRALDEIIANYGVMSGVMVAAASAVLLYVQEHGMPSGMEDYPKKRQPAQEPTTPRSDD